jgi:4a-hydroxytetrahydrobiopterin dehydratase
MTDTLAEKACTPCRGGIPPLTRDQAARYRSQLPDWELLDDARQSRRTCRFKNFRDALALVRAVGELAEAEGHHPEIGFGWSHATVLLQTRKIKGLHENDLILAARIDRLAGETSAHV